MGLYGKLLHASFVTTMVKGLNTLRFTSSKTGLQSVTFKMANGHLRWDRNFGKKTYNMISSDYLPRVQNTSSSSDYNMIFRYCVSGLASTPPGATRKLKPDLRSYMYLRLYDLLPVATRFVRDPLQTERSRQLEMHLRRSRRLNTRPSVFVRGNQLLTDPLPEE